MGKRITKDEFIARATKIHNNVYQYDKVEYINMHKKVCIIDPKYGEFWQTPMGHILMKQGHPERGRIRAGNKRKLGLDQFIARANKKHNNLYNYSKVEYVNIDTKVCIVDPKYGEFWQSPYQHLNSHGCPARTANKEWPIHIDHIIPLAIVHPGNRSPDKWFKQRPLYKFLDSDINKQKLESFENLKKSDHVYINGKKVYCNSIRNNYDAIHYLISTILHIDPTEIIDKDKLFIKLYFGLI